MAVMLPVSFQNNRPDTCLVALLNAVGAFCTIVFIGTITIVSAEVVPAYENVSDQLPIKHVYDGDWEFYVGGGVAVFDCNDDGLPDVFAAGGRDRSILLRNDTSEPGAPLSFKLTQGRQTRVADVIGAYPIDIDGDEVLDLFLLRVGANRVLKGLGDCDFEDATRAWSIDAGKSWSTAFSATWEAGYDFPTLAVGNYVDRDNADGPFGSCDSHQLLRPSRSPDSAPAETNTTVKYATAETIAPGYCTLSMLFTDWSGTGRQDLWISNDRHYYVHEGHEQLFSIQPEIKEYSELDGWAEYKLWGMGIASRDITGDGLPEIAITSMADQKLFTLDDAEQPRFKSISHARGMTAHIPYIGHEGRPSTGWHVQFGDVDNDGLDDIFIAKGNVNQMPSAAMADPDNLLVQGTDGRFTEKGYEAGIASTERSRGAALVDFDRDGRLDLLVVQRRAPMILYQNVTQSENHWVSIELRQLTENRFAVGARIELETDSQHVVREIQLGGGHAGGQMVAQHFGLGAKRKARFRVRWPDGSESSWHEVLADRHYQLERRHDPVASIVTCVAACTQD